MRLTLCVSPRMGTERRLSIERELRMIKSSLLYADHISVVSPGLNMLRTLDPLRKVSLADPVNGLRALPTPTLIRMGFPASELPRLRQRVQELSKLPVDDPERSQWAEKFAPAFQEAAVLASDQYGGHGPEMDRAIESEALTVIDTGFDFDEGADSVAAWYKKQLSGALSDHSSGVLLDPETSKLARESEDSGHFGSYAASRSRRASTGTGLVERLPTFPNAPMEHILEAREELTDHRQGYRNAVKRLERGLESAALDDSLPYELDELWHDEVQPQPESSRIL